MCVLLEEMNTKSNKRKLLPPFIMLLAGSSVSVAMYVLHYDLKQMLKILLITLIVFYIVGCLIEKMLNRFEADIEKRLEEEQANLDEGEVIEKEQNSDEEASENGTEV